MSKYAVLLGQRIVRIAWAKWPNEHRLEIEVEGGHVLEIEPCWDSNGEGIHLEAAVNDDALR